MDEGVAVQQDGLHEALAGQVDGAFRVPHLVRVAEGLAGVPVGELPAEFVDEEESRDEEEFADERGPPGGGPRLRRLGTGIHPPAPLLTYGSCGAW